MHIFDTKLFMFEKYASFTLKLKLSGQFACQAFAFQRVYRLVKVLIVVNIS